MGQPEPWETDEAWTWRNKPGDPDDFAALIHVYPQDTYSWTAWGPGGRGVEVCAEGDASTLESARAAADLALVQLYPPDES